MKPKAIKTFFLNSKLLNIVNFILYLFYFSNDKKKPTFNTIYIFSLTLFFSTKQSSFQKNNKNYKKIPIKF